MGDSALLLFCALFDHCLSFVWQGVQWSILETPQPLPSSWMAPSFEPIVAYSQSFLACFQTVCMQNKAFLPSPGLTCHNQYSHCYVSWPPLLLLYIDTGSIWELNYPEWGSTGSLSFFFFSSSVYHVQSVMSGNRGINLHLRETGTARWPTLHVLH